MMKPTLKTFGSLLLTGSFLAGFSAATGCAHAPSGARVDRVSEVEYPQVVVEGSFRRRIVMSAPTVRMDPGVPMSVSVPVRYTPRHILNNETCDAQYRFIFLASDGRPLNANPAWKYVNLPARTQVFLSGSAMDMGATDWRCEIRPNDEERD